MSKLRWMVVDVTTGKFDGHYASKEDAEAQALHWLREHPNRSFYVVEVHGVTGRSGIPASTSLGREWISDQAARRQTA